jgi:hypothetical protein
VVIKTSGGVITDVWKNVHELKISREFAQNSFAFKLKYYSTVEAIGEIYAITFSDIECEAGKKFREYVEYHSVLDHRPYSEVLKQNNQLGI